MAAIVIRDLNISKEIDKKAMETIFGGINQPALPAGWSLISQQTQRANASIIWVPSKHIPGAFENTFMLQNVTTITAQYTEYGTG